jgi:hypothetical protein
MYAFDDRIRHNRSRIEERRSSQTTELFNPYFEPWRPSQTRVILAVLSSLKGQMNDGSSPRDSLNGRVRREPGFSGSMKGDDQRGFKVCKGHGLSPDLWPDLSLFVDNLDGWFLQSCSLGLRNVNDVDDTLQGRLRAEIDDEEEERLPPHTLN